MQKNRKSGKNVEERVTGSKMLRFRVERAMSDANMCELFGLSPGKMKSILASGDVGVDDPVVCYLYRQYESYPELTGGDIDIRTLYEMIGGKESIRGSDFALILGRELSAYIRHFNSGRPTPSLRTVIRNAMKLSGNDPIKAFEHIRELCKLEGASRGFDPLEARTWRNPTAERSDVKSPIKRKPAVKPVAVKKVVAKPKKQAGK